MKLQFKITFKQGNKTVGEVLGKDNVVDAGTLTMDDVVDGVTKAELFLEKLTGHKVHIEQVQ